VASSCGAVNFLLSSSRLLTGTLWICIMEAWPPVATKTWLLSLMFLFAFMMRLGVNSRYFLPMLDVPERIRELLPLSRSLFYLRSRRGPTLCCSFRPLLLLFPLLLLLLSWLVMLSLGVSTFLSAYLRVAVMLCGLFWVQLFIEGRVGSSCERSMDTIVYSGCDAIYGSNPPWMNSRLRLYKAVAWRYLLREGNLVHSDFSVS
jgi:hypothetical protein